MRILYLTFYFEPDLCAGSFRNTPLAKQISKSLLPTDKVHVITTLPNRYSSYKIEAGELEQKNYNLHVNRIFVPSHKSDLFGQIKSFNSYFWNTLSHIKGENYDIVFASSSRLFTAFLGAYIARKRQIPLYLDIRDIFKESIGDIIRKKYILLILNPILTFIENFTFGYASHINLVSEGFKDYFSKYKKPKFSYYTNGIDENFLVTKQSESNPYYPKIILYAGNLGEGQGLHKIIPKAAKALGNNYHFKVIGDGGAKHKLVKEIKLLQLTNIEMLDPVNRRDLVNYYEKADFLFLHLNDYPAFEKVLPSKIFEYGSFDKPIIAGVAGFAAEFIYRNVENHILFSPGDVESLVSQLRNYEPKFIRRTEFIKKFSRDQIVKNLVNSIISTVV